ncbi:MAG: DUF3040 domain-containing protein [Microbacterium sp.]|uniref:DUF3040 domain-containing protein n=1 Tax=Microbacterium sp. TaxID=51671 RepID=UPI001AC78E36|nr:DUF3040 domain-containing protein [Microbacterium sp.]MBN9152477.1 DUF3040 domain-containing protein [Microbacterium sp.]MBN9175009.1 DUF3040 domain-containing protein [Microbacterium sp.]
MPLSEQEQRLLDEMERHLMHNDADVVTASRDGRTLSYRNIVYGTVLVLVGLGGLIAGVAGRGAIGLVIVGVVGFVLMLGGVILAVTPTRAVSPRPVQTSAPSTPRKSASFMDRMNDRWDRRQEDR